MDDAAADAEGFCLAVELVSEALDVVGAVDDGDGVRGEGAFDGGGEGGARGFLTVGAGVGGAGQVEGVVGYEVDFVHFGGWGTGGRGEGGEGGVELVCAVGFAAGGMAGEEDELRRVELGWYLGLCEGWWTYGHEIRWK